MIRITGGEFQGRQLSIPQDSFITRPSLAKVRQAIFNSLYAFLSDSRVLDLFSGIGTLGIEAISRGATFVAFVENHRKILNYLNKNISTFGISSLSEVIPKNIDQGWSQVKRFAPYHLIFVDPPYKDRWEHLNFSQYPWDEILVPQGRICIKWGLQFSKRPEEKKLMDPIKLKSGFLVKIREKSYGETMVTFYEFRKVA